MIALMLLMADAASSNAPVTWGMVLAAALAFSAVCLVARELKTEAEERKHSARLKEKNA